MKTAEYFLKEAIGEIRWNLDGSVTKAQLKWAMDEYAKYYHETEVKKLHKPDVVRQNTDELSTKNETKALNKHNVICCGVLEQMLIAWFVDPNGKKVMPYIPGENGEMFRVNNCPSCGAYVRECSKP